MKSLICLMTWLAIGGRAGATSVSLEWDKNPEAQIAYTIEAKPGGELDPGEWEQVASTPALFITITSLRPGLWSFRARAVTLDGELRSDPSNVVTTAVLPDAPKGLRIVLEASRDMQEWEPVATYDVPDSDRQFYRIAFTP